MSVIPAKPVHNLVVNELPCCYLKNQRSEWELFLARKDKVQGGKCLVEWNRFASHNALEVWESRIFENKASHFE